jgi:hypothetical protein
MSCLETVNGEFEIGFWVTWTGQIGYDVSKGTKDKVNPYSSFQS